MYLNNKNLLITIKSTYSHHNNTDGTIENIHLTIFYNKMIYNVVTFFFHCTVQYMAK